MPVSHNRRKKGESKILHKQRILKRKNKLETIKIKQWKDYKAEVEAKQKAREDKLSAAKSEEE